MNYYRQITNINDNQIYDTKYGNINGDNIVDTVYIVGQKPVDQNIRFIKNIKIIIEDGKTKQLHTINLKINAGFNPKLSLIKLSKSNINYILISIDVGEIDSTKYIYLYSFINNISKKIFDYEEFNNRFNYNISYIDNYKVIVENLDLNKRFVIDIKDKGVNYLSNIYNPDGTLKAPKKGAISGISNISEKDINKDGITDLIVTQKVIGLYNTDILGTIDTPLTLENNKLIVYNNEQYLSKSISEI